MITIASREWIADLGAMVCRNIDNKIIVVFEKNGNNLSGKIKDIPMKLFSRWAAEPNGETHIKNTVKEAEEVFLRAYYEVNEE
jgi:hypothetical protein